MGKGNVNVFVIIITGLSYIVSYKMCNNWFSLLNSCKVSVHWLDLESMFWLELISCYLFHFMTIEINYFLYVNIVVATLQTLLLLINAAYYSGKYFPLYI